MSIWLDWNNIRTNIWLAPWAGKMNQIAHCDWLPERARWLSITLPARDYPLYPARKISWKPYNKSFIDQACSVKMAGYWPRSFFARLWTSTSSRSMTRKKELGQYPTILTERARSITLIIYKTPIYKTPTGMLYQAQKPHTKSSRLKLH